MRHNFFFVLGVVAVHLMLLYSVFDVYFTSPLVTGRDAIDPAINMEREEDSEYASNNARLSNKLSGAGVGDNRRYEPPAKRLVLFVADGFRADSMYENDMKNTPFLREVVRQIGAVGTAQTRVPTESRPGHVAMLAGVYEDVSAITTGWRSNPVDVDSLLNRSTAAYAFGSADIVLPFVDAAVTGDSAHERKRRHVAAFTYGGELQNFARAETWKLDAFAFDKFEQLLANYSALKTRRVDSAEKRKSIEMDADSEWYAQRAGRDGAVFLVHLLGLDVAGHSFKPGSRELARNARYVDERVRRAVQVANHAFGDCETLFVVTADHGMTDWGSHGASTRHETVVPLVAFGAATNYAPLCGVGLPSEFEEVEFFSKFNMDSATDTAVAVSLDSLPTYSVEQADLCPLLAALLGLRVPANSVGVLPSVATARRALASTTVESSAFARYYVVQARHCVALLDAKRAVARRRRGSLPPFSFRDFSELPVADAAARLRSLAAAFRHLDALADVSRTAQLDQLADESRQLCYTALRGFSHFHNHDAPVLGAIIALTFLSSSVCALMRTVDADADTDSQMTKTQRSAPLTSLGFWLFLLANVLVTALCYVQNVKFSHSLYCLLCVWTLAAALSSIRANWRWLRVALCVGGTSTCMNLIVVLLSVETGLLAFEHRSALAVAQLLFCLSPILNIRTTPDRRQNAGHSERAKPRFNALHGSTELVQRHGAARPDVSSTTDIDSRSEHNHRVVNRSEGKLAALTPSWLVANGCLSVFCMLPTIGSWTNSWLVLASGIVFLAAYIVVFIPHTTPRVPISAAERVGLILFVTAVGLSTFVGVCVEQRVEIGSACHVLSWSLATACLSLPCFTPPATLEQHNSNMHAFPERLRVLLLAFATIYFSMTIAYEGFFLVALVVVVATWSQGTARSVQESTQVSWSEQARLVASFVHLVFFSFFGTGNLASINSFNVQSVYAYVTVFSPFTMTALMLFKIIIPFVLVSCAFVPMTRSSGVPLRRVLLFTLMLSDLMALQFFFAVRNEGSWFEIGSSISRYVIVMSISIFAFLLFALAHALLSGNPLGSLRKVAHLVRD